MPDFFKSKTKQRITAVLLLLGCLFFPVSGAASHYCFDGLEPSVSVHFDYFNGHEFHDDAEQHFDTEKQLLAEHLVCKYFDSDFFLSPSDYFNESDLGLSTPYQHYRAIIPEPSSLWLNSPPLRAPPQPS